MQRSNVKTEEILEFVLFRCLCYVLCATHASGLRPGEQVLPAVH
jgi:hypothetical protein